MSDIILRPDNVMDSPYIDWPSFCEYIFLSLRLVLVGMSADFVWPLVFKKSFEISVIKKVSKYFISLLNFASSVRVLSNSPIRPTETKWDYGYFQK